MEFGLRVFAASRPFGQDDARGLRSFSSGKGPVWSLAGSLLGLRPDSPLYEPKGRRLTDEAGMREIDAILKRYIKDPTAPAFMAPPSKRPTQALAASA